MKNLFIIESRLRTDDFHKKSYFGLIIIIVTLLVSCNKIDSNQFYTDIKGLSYIPELDISYEIIEENYLLDGIIVDIAITENGQKIAIDKEDVPDQVFRFDKKYENIDGTICCCLDGNTCGFGTIDTTTVVIIKFPPTL